MSKRRKSNSQSQISKTEDIDVTFGAFQIGEHRVQFMNSILRFQQIAEYLNLVTDNPKYARQDWTIDELFQRDVNHSRVLDIVKNYLNTSCNRPQFFNSLTVVLIPMELEHDETYKEPTLNDEQHWDHKVTIGPITVGFGESAEGKDYPANGSFGSVTWNRDQVSAVAIDGQHRLASIKEFYRRNTAASKDSSVSVIFLLLDEKLGHLEPQKINQLKTMRSLFIDLNKHAVPVSRSRNLLLDDMDTVAACVRSLFSNSLSYEIKEPEELFYTLPIGKNEEFKKCLPLNIVDWHGESKSKIERGPYVASVLSLEWIVKKVLNNGSPQMKIIPHSFNPDDDNYYENVKRTLESWKSSWENEIKKRYEECKDVDLAFNLNANEVKALSNEFRDTWGIPIVRILSGIKDYNELIKYRIDEKTLTPEFAQWYQAKSLYDSNSNNSIDIINHYKGKLEDIENELKDHDVKINKYRTALKVIDSKIKVDSIFYYLVGQRSAISAFVSMTTSRRAIKWAKAIDDDISQNYKHCVQDFYARYLVDGINDVINSGSKGKKLFKKSAEINQAEGTSEGISPRFWAGSIVKRDNPDEMDFSDVAVERGARWLTLIVHLYWFYKLNLQQTNKSTLKNDILLAIDDSSILNKYSSGLGEELGTAIDYIIGTDDREKSTRCPASFLIGVLGDNWKYDLVKTACKARILHLISIMETINIPV